MNNCENMLSRSVFLQNAINRRNYLHDDSCAKFPNGQRDLDSSMTSSNDVNSTTISNGNSVEDASTDYARIVNNTSKINNVVNGINGNVNTVSNSSEISKEHSNCDPSHMVPLSIHSDAIIVKKPLCRLDYSVRNTAAGSLPRRNSDLWTLHEQDESNNENGSDDGGDDGDDVGDDDDDDKNYDNCDSDYDNGNVIGDGIWGVCKKKKKSNHLEDVKGSETETVKERNRRGGDGVCVEKEKKNNEKEKNSSGSGDEKSGEGNITKEESKAGWQEDEEKRRKWEAIREVKEEGVAEEKRKEEEQEALTPNCYSSNEYEFETACEEIGLLEVKVEKQLCGASVHSPTMLRLTTTTTSCHDTAPTNVTWSDSCRNPSDTKRLGNNLKTIKQTTAMPKRLETEFNTDNHCDETVPLVDTVTSQQRANDPTLAALPSPLLPCPPSPALPLATLSSPTSSVLPHSNHLKHLYHHQNFLKQQQKHNQPQQSHAHFLLPPDANLTVSTNSIPSCGNNSPVSTVSASSTSSSSSSSPSPSSPQTTHSSVVEEDKQSKEEDPFHTEVLDSNPDYPTTGHSINDIIKMSLEDYVVLKDEENRRLSVDVLPNANNKPRQSYCKMVSQNILNGTENVGDDVQSTNALKTNLRKSAAKKRQRKQTIPNDPKADDEKNKKDIEDNKKSVRDGFFIILSGMYGLLLVVLGAVIPISETFSNLTTLYFFDAFYIYLYIGSCLFILYVYTFLLRRNTKTMGHRFSFYRQWSRSLNRSWSFGKRSEKNGERNDGRHRRNFTTDVAPHNPNGSFYLRLGAIGFGIGGMIHSGLQLGQHLQLIGGSNDCDGLMQIVKPLFHLVFTFVQLYFVFLNPKVCIHRYKTLARFGLMHMCGTNICVWFRNIVVETLHEMHSGIAHSSNGHGSHGHDHPLVEHHQNNHTTHPSIHVHTVHHVKNTHHIEHSHNSSLQLHSNHNENVSSKLIAAMVSTVNSHETKALKTLPDVNCYWNKMMGKVVEQAGPYLYPCSIEYSLICAGIMFVLWQQVGRGPKPIFTKTNGQNADDDFQESRSYRLSVDCGGSSRGLFLGILLFVGAVITMVAFYVLVHKENMTITALALVHLSEIIIYLLGLIATVTAAWRMRGLAYKPGHASVLENVLILISLTGVFIFCLFGIIAALFHEESGITNTLSIASNLMMIIQSIVQTVFMAVGAEMQAYTQAQERQKPGRELVTFLILCNLSLWGINTFETQRAEHNPIQTDFYGHMAWAILTHISVPLGIFFRFHSTVCLSNIWKNAWKIRHH